MCNDVDNYPHSRGDFKRKPELQELIGIFEDYHDNPENLAQDILENGQTEVPNDGSGTHYWLDTFEV